MIQLCESEERVADYIAMFDDFSKKTDDLIKMDDEYKLRLVDSRNNLREKVYNFDHSLDDRVIEIMKLFIRFDISKRILIMRWMKSFWKLVMMFHQDLLYVLQMDNGAVHHLIRRCMTKLKKK